MQKINQVDIQPSVAILSALKHLNYTAWFALAEFVDNALDSFFKNKNALYALNLNYKLKVEIFINQKENSITIFDNAAGISQNDFNRALKTATIPPDNSGLSEFGMGMKSAACWFAACWKLESTAINEDIQRSVFFDVQKIIENKIDSIEVENYAANFHTHGTNIKLFNVYNIPKTSTLKKIKEHLSSIYRDFFRKDFFELYLNNELLSYNEPKILNAPYYKNLESESIYWRQDIPNNFPLRDGLSISRGFIGILETMEAGKSGFALFRRGRVILGSGEEGFKPEAIFGQPGSFKNKRIFGELHLEGFMVSHTKDGFRNDEDIEIFIEILAEFLGKQEKSLLKQADGYRVKASNGDYQKSAQIVIKKTIELAQHKVPDAVSQLLEDNKNGFDEPEFTIIANEQLSSEFFEIDFNSTRWLVHIELSWDESPKDWIELGDKYVKQNNSIDPKKNQNCRQIGIRLSLKHPFCIQFAGSDKSRIMPLLRIAVAIGLSEVIAKDSGVDYAYYFRLNINRLLSEALL